MDTVNWRTIEELREMFIEKYTRLGGLKLELVTACNDEYELKRDYNGRQILELLQNVDDVYNKTKSNKLSSVKITYKNNILEVGNTGTTFTAETIESLCMGRASGKSSADIGNKGTGFRSLLNDAEWIEVHSGNFHIKFSEKYTKETFEKYKDNELIKEQLVNWKKDYDLCFPIMNMPEEIEPVNSDFDTLIRVKVKPENDNKETGIKKQLSLPFYKALLFLPNISKIEVETETETKYYEKVYNNGVVELRENDTIIDSFYIQNKKVDFVVENKDKIAKLVIAIPLDDNYDFTQETLYCYFPIRNCKTPVHALIHAPFLTNNSRDDIPNDDNQINRKLLTECFKFLKEIAEKIAQEKVFKIDLPITTLSPIDRFIGKIWSDGTFNMKPYYINLLTNAKLLPTVNGEFISIEDKPKYIDGDFPQEFRGVQFNNLLVKLKDEVYRFIEELCLDCSYYRTSLLYKYNLSELREKINEISLGFDIATAVKIFLWWSDFSEQSTSPKLLKDTMGNWVEQDDTKKVYLPTDNSVAILPESLNWVNLCVLRQDYVDELIKQIQNKKIDSWNSIKQKLDDKTANKRTLDNYSDEYLSIKFKEQSTSELVISDINGQIDTKEKSIAFLNWFFENYQDKFEENSTLNRTNYNLVDIGGNIVSSKKLYMGREYGNNLTAKIFEGLDYSPIAPMSEIFKGNEEDKELFIEFLKKCGVLVFPRIYDANLLGEDGFSSFIKKQHNVEYNINYLEAKKIDGFQKILERLSTEEIVEWFKSDAELRNLIILDEAGGFYAQRSNSAKNIIKSNEYIKWVINKTKWIELGGEKYSPKQIVKKYSKLEDKIPELYGVSPNCLEEKLGIVASEFKLDFANSMAELPDAIIHKILLKLPEVDNTGEISRTLYSDIIKNKKDMSPTYKLDDIKVLCLDGEFRSNKDVKYAPRKVPRRAIDKSCLVDISTKQSTVTINKWLGVEEYKLSLEVEDYKVLDNNEVFEEELNELKIALLSTMDETSNFITRTKHLKVLPCGNVQLKDSSQDNRLVELEDYNYIKSSGVYLVKLPRDYTKAGLEQTHDFNNSIVEIFEDAVSTSIDKNLLGRLVSSTSENRKRIIADQFGIDRWFYVEELLEQQKSRNEIVLNGLLEMGLDEKYLENLKSIDFTRSLSIAGYKVLKEALLSINKDIEDLNSISKSINIDIRSVIRDEFNNYKELKIDTFKSAYYNYLKDKEDNQTQFIIKCNKFVCFELEEIENSVKVSIEEEFNKVVKTHFDNVSLEIDDIVNIDEIYNQNYQKCIDELGANEKDFEFFLEKNKDIKSLLYFKVPALKDTYDKFIQEESLLSQDKEISKAQTLETRTVETVLVYRENRSSKKTEIRGEASQKNYEEKSDNSERKGKRAEEIAYNELKKDYPKIIWHSKNSTVPADRNKAPTNVTCDMWNIDSEGNKIYFEIKSSTNDFEMSINEYNSMKDNPDNYEVVLVNVEKGTISRHKFTELDKLKQVGKYFFSFEQQEK